MAEYIEFEATKQAIDRIRSVYHRARNFNAVSVIDNVFGEIKEIPAADVAPVVHGRWVYNPNGMDWNLGAWQCSVCKCNNNNLPGNDKYNPYIFQGSNFCPKCGAKMDGEEHNNV